MIKKENIEPMLDAKYIRVFDLQYAEGRHYYDATRRSIDDLVAAKSDEEFRAMLPDAVSCAVIIIIKSEEPRLLLTREYRYPAGQFLLSPPAGLLDAEDAKAENPILSAAARELKEETNLVPKDGDKLFVINPFLFSSPGMTDESNALACAVFHLENASVINQEGAVGSEQFDGFMLLNKEEARKILADGWDAEGIFYSVYTWAVLMYFISDMWM